MSTALHDRERMLHAVGRVAAVLVFFAMWAAPTPAGLPPAAQRVAAVTALMSVLWLTQSIPIAATSLIPLAAYPLLGIQSAADVSKSYVDPNVFLFLGGFVIALGIEKWGLHQRMALYIVWLLGTSLKRVVLGFMAATAFLSMWISNTASALLMLPLGTATLTSLEEMFRNSAAASQPADGSSQQAALPGEIERTLARLSAVLLIGIAYAASIGGMMTLVGTPTNIQFRAIFAAQFPDGPQISAAEWMIVFVPMGAAFLVLAWLVLAGRLRTPAGAPALDRGFFRVKLRALGRPSTAESAMLVIFCTTAALWIFRKPLQLGPGINVPGWGDAMIAALRRLGASGKLAEFVDDSTVAIAMSLLMFVIPARRGPGGRPEYLMDWRTVERVPWGILLLIGGGFAIANAFRDTGLSLWLGEWFASAAGDLPLWLLIVAVCVMLTILTEFTTNVATVSATLPVLAGAAVGMGLDPRLVMLPATLAASCGFMLPIATPPNAIAFASGKVRMATMARYGLILNLLGVLLVTAAMFLLAMPQLGISPDGIPDWAAEGGATVEDR